MEKRLVVFLVLSLAIILGYEFVLNELGLIPPPPSDESSTEESSPQSAADSRQMSVPSVGADAQGPSKRFAPSTSRSQSPGSVEPQTVEVETGLYRARLNSRGAVLTGWELKHYRGSAPSRPPVELVRQGGKFADPLAIGTHDAALTRELNEGTYRVEQDFQTLDQTNPTGHVVFSYESADGEIRLEKRLTFHADSYVVDIELNHRGLGEFVEVGLGTNFGIVEWGEGFIGAIGPVSMVDGERDVSVPDSEAERQGMIQWAGLQDKYFLGVIIPQKVGTVRVKKEDAKLVSSVVRFSVGAEDSLGFRLYAGPKEYDALRSLQIGLEDTIDFGWFIFGSWSVVKSVAKPIFYVLRAINEHTHNYGVTIILLTVVIKVIFIPLQYKSYKAMKQMQEIQPKILALQEKFKDDRDRLNRELIKVYRDNKVNPVGGCLPMLLQMPVFVALFNILNVAIDLRQAPFALWIDDLSVQDPYYVFPIVMGITMVIQQKITPTTMDPTQAKVMLMLPVFMTFLFLNFPAGLVLYWMTLNTLNIVQQLVTEQLFFPRPQPTPAVGEEAEKK
ncbi:MAG: membrane protein insertase YidC [Nitrospira sp.]|nr:membrane protein insertase YidC [Nitrospira sp.]MCP9441976.1 membrane protein insertase YidC [Nitrospira sp.]